MTGRNPRLRQSKPSIVGRRAACCAKRWPPHAVASARAGAHARGEGASRQHALTRGRRTGGAVRNLHAGRGGVRGRDHPPKMCTSVTTCSTNKMLRGTTGRTPGGRVHFPLPQHYYRQKPRANVNSPPPPPPACRVRSTPRRAGFADHFFLAGAGAAFFAADFFFFAIAPRLCEWAEERRAGSLQTRTLSCEWHPLPRTAFRTTGRNTALARGIT